MIKPEEIKEKALKKYKDFLKYEIDSIYGQVLQPFFPLVIRADTGKVSDDLLKRQKDLQLLISKSKNKTGKGYSLKLGTVCSRNNGEQTTIEQIFFESTDDFLDFINERKSYLRFKSALKIISENNLMSTEDFISWAKVNISYLIIEYDEENFWENICLCVNWLNNNQGSNLYIREIPLPVHTKFIENNKSIIKSLSLKADSEGVFEDIFGLKGKHDFVRFRSLDPENIKIKVSQNPVEECNIRVTDFSLMSTDFYRCIKNIFIVENEMIYLTFPDYKNSICIWGHGYTVNTLKNVNWMNNCNLFYFGDLDEHGFDILSNFRSQFNKTKSFCMDEQTFNDFSNFVVKGKKLEGERIPEYLTDDELSCFMKLRKSDNNRLEQERISNQYIQTRLNNLII